MPGCFCARGVSDKCSSARAAIVGSATAQRIAAASPEVNHDVRQGAVISNHVAAGTVMPNASAATGAGAAKGPAQKK